MDRTPEEKALIKKTILELQGPCPHSITIKRIFVCQSYRDHEGDCYREYVDGSGKLQTLRWNPSTENRRVIGPA